MSLNAYATRYISDSIATASPARLVTMLYDRLVRDLTMAEAAIDSGDRAVAGEQLVHAQDIIMELRTTLDVTVWEGGPALASLYDYLYGQLVNANVKQDVEIVQTCKRLIVPLQQAWHAAADEIAAAGPTMVASA